MTSLASNLEGKNVNGWNIGKKISKADSTGGCFSSGYFVEHNDGRKAFMKAINIGYVMGMFDPRVPTMDRLREITDAFTFERDMHAFCDSQGMDRIVVALDHGEYREDGYPYFVPYLVFELCEQGDIRRHARMHDPKLAWRLDAFHGVCVGLKQLHAGDVAHQDLKPSNVMVPRTGKPKIGDLGRATVRGGVRNGTPHHCGDPDYTPIELHYGHFEPDWDVRRKGADFYMLGGVFAFLVANVHIFSLVLQHLPRTYHPGTWTGSYSDVLPEVRAATSRAIADIVAVTDERLRDRVKDMLEWLCEPDPKRRGHPKNLDPKAMPYSLERIITCADVLAKRAFVLLS